MPGTWARYSGSDPWLAGEVPTPAEINNIGRSIREIGWGAAPGTISINYNQNNIVAMGNLYFHSTAGKIASPLTVSPGVSFSRYNGVFLIDGDSVSLETLGIGNNGWLITHCSDGVTFGLHVVQAGYNSVYEVLDPNARIATSDTAGKLCIIPDGDSTYTLKNRLGGEAFFSLYYMGF